MMKTVELIEAIESFRFNADSPESKSGLVALYTEVFFKPFDIGCGACYNDAWQKLLKWKRNQVKGNSEIKKQFMAETNYQFKKGYPKNGKVAIRANGTLVNVTPENLNDFLAETLLQTPYAHMIELKSASEKKSEEPLILKVKHIASTSNGQPNDGSEQSESASVPESELSDLPPSKEATKEAEPKPASEATATASKKRGRKAKSAV